MNKTKWIAISITALLVFILLINSRVSPFVSLRPSSTPTSDPGITGGSPATQPAPDLDTLGPERTRPPLNWGYVDFPDLAGFEKAVVDEFAMVIYSNGQESVIMQYMTATQEQLDELAQGGGPSLAPLIDNLVRESTISSSKLIDLPGLEREGLEFELTLDDEYEYIGLIIPSEGQVLALFGVSQTANRQVLMDAYHQLIQSLKLTI